MQTGPRAQRQYDIPTSRIVQELPDFTARGITEFIIHDKHLASDKKEILRIADAVRKYAPELFISIPVSIKIIDKDFLAALSDLFCSLEIPLDCTEKGGALLLDKKMWSSKAKALNEAGTVFGFSMGWGTQAGDTFRMFRTRLDFALSLYPNHINFPQFGKDNGSVPGTGVFSSKDMDFARGMAFACRTFYTAGRAVPWFNSATQALRILPSQFFADFDEWQQCNNCSQITGFVPEERAHTEIERMQITFLKEKCAEKHREHIFPALSDTVRLNGAFSRLTENGEESTLDLSYNPDDILSPCSMSLCQFAENVTMESCTVRIFDSNGIPDYKIL